MLPRNWTDENYHQLQNYDEVYSKPQRAIGYQVAENMISYNV